MEICGTCDICKQPKEIMITAFGIKEKKKVMCECERVENEAKKEKFKQQQRSIRLADMRRNGFFDPAYSRHTFDVDDSPNSYTSQVCRNYVINWKKMFADNAGLLLCGGVGVGKSFYACCVANELINSGYNVMVSTAAELISRMFDRNESMSLMKMIRNYPLMIIDDFGSERDSEYAIEQLYIIVDSRYRSDKPLIVTTNLLPEDLANFSDIRYQRIGDRILERCVVVRSEGESRRIAAAGKRFREYEKVLGVKAKKKD